MATRNSLLKSIYDQASLANANITHSAYRFSTLTAGTPQGGRVRLNNTDASLATEVVFSAFNEAGSDVSSVVVGIITVGNSLYIQDITDSQSAYLFSVAGEIVDNGDHFVVPVTYDRGVGTISNNARSTVVYGLASGAGGSASGVLSVIGGQKIGVDNTDPQNPIINFDPAADLGGGTWSE